MELKINRSEGVFLELLENKVPLSQSWRPRRISGAHAQLAEE